ncbi:16S rRNA (guanine(966)-N(2))-methyltransferase RsmD [Neisseria weaveri]|uniref:16S rRNA (guanine(966)-N(2))-methyltransferase RsmD n=1 Tax=Neisseria weaveri TaxID=28091 RepID=UPI000D325B63|nr:16S rRNA (guanine(966)-N(2))-methyltransferase RsmD [Neisseria weaveri]
MIKQNSKHTNQVRIIGGSCRGRKLPFVSADGLRPTPDMVREKLFNWLGQDLTGSTVLDLFGGSGALGLEAASRNASEIVLVDNHKQTVQCLKKNAELLGLEKIKVIHSDGLLFLKGNTKKFNVIFLDPPFQWQNWNQLFLVLKPSVVDGTWVYVEAGAMPEFPEWLECIKKGKSGKSNFSLLKVVSD